MDMFWIESEFVDKVGTKKGYSWDRKWTYAIISAFCQNYIPISRRAHGDWASTQYPSPLTTPTTST